ncbi:MAG: hypothetical protein HFH86_01345 [Bacilli bacterium]|nr:hypothetical protein [Bacilli bacterium]
MREIRSNQIKSIVKKAKTNLVIWAIVTICGAAIFALSFFMDDIRKSTNFHEILAAGETAENKLVSVEVSEKPYVFAYYPNDNSGKFYFLWDEEFMYVAFLSEKEFNRLNQDDIKDHHLKVTGITKTIPSDIKKLALDAYNEAVDKEYQITSSEFADYFGYLYLDETEVDVTTVLCLIIGMIAYFTGFCCLIAQIINFVKLKKRMKKMSDEDWEALNIELDAEEAFYYKNAKLALTKNYLVDFSHGMKVIKYQDILWMYRYEYRYNGINTQLSIILYTNDKKRHIVAPLVGYTKKSKIVNQEIMESIAQKNDKMIIGYNSENRKKMKEEYQIKA